VFIGVHISFDCGPEGRPVAAKLLFAHSTVDADAAGAYEQDGEKDGEIKIGLFVNHAVYHRHVSSMSPEFGYPHAYDGNQRGKTGEETKGDQQTAEQFREDNEGQGDAMADMKRIGKDILKMTEILEFIDAIIQAEDQAESEPKYEECDVEGAFIICGREKFFHVRLGFASKIIEDHVQSWIYKEMLNVPVIHRCLERYLVKGKIIRIFSALPADRRRLQWPVRSAHPLDESHQSNYFPVKHTVLSFFVILLCFSAFAQQTRYYDDPQAEYKQGVEFFEHDFYSLAFPIFRHLNYSLRATDKSNNSVEYADVKYYYLVCALEQNDQTAVAAAEDYIELENNAPRVGMISFHLGEYYFRTKDYNSAIKQYEHADIDNLSNRDIADLKFHEGYCFFTLKQFDNALPLFNAIRQLPKDPNYIDANYYYGFICFYQKKYSDALDAFRIVEDNPTYEKVVPYYVANIYLVQGQKDKAISYAEAHLKKGNQYYDAELRQLVGHGYYEKQDFAKALPFLESYVNQSKKVTRGDLYELSYCYYQTNNWNKAIDGFKQLGGKDDSLAQNSMYLLGDSYLRTGQKANARNAFMFCSINSSNPKQKEISKFNYAKLSYELGFPDLALSELQGFLQQYPGSTYTREARELLVNVLAGTSNYKDALSMLDSLDHPSDNVKRLIPRILYGRATELVNDGLLTVANDLLDRALKDPNNGSVLPYIKFWKGEIAYRLSKII
jgi:TolA-binding protein